MTNLPKNPKPHYEDEKKDGTVKAICIVAFNQEKFNSCQDKSKMVAG